MKKNVSFFLLVLFSFTLSVSQTKTEYENFDIFRGPKKKIKTDKYFNELMYIGNDSGNYYALSIPESAFNPKTIGRYLRQYRVFKIDSSLTNYASVVIPQEIEGHKTDIEFMLKLKNDFYVFSSYENHKHKKTYLFAQKIDKQTLSVSPDAKMVVEVDYSNYNRYKKTHFSYTYSADSSQVLFSHHLTDKDNLILNMGITLFDDNLEKQWTTHNIPIPEEGYFTMDQFVICKNGDLFIIGKHNTKKKDLKKQYQFLNYTYKAVLIYDKGTKAAYFDFNLPGQSVYRLSGVLNRDNSILRCAGLYISDETSKITGTCYFEIDKERKEFTKQSMTPYDDSFPITNYNIDRKMAAIDKIAINLTGVSSKIR